MQTTEARSAAARALGGMGGAFEAPGIERVTEERGCPGALRAALGDPLEARGIWRSAEGHGLPGTRRATLGGLGGPFGARGIERLAEGHGLPGTRRATLGGMGGPFGAPHQTSVPHHKHHRARPLRGSGLSRDPGGRSLKGTANKDPGELALVLRRAVPIVDRLDLLGGPRR